MKIIHISDLHFGMNNSQIMNAFFQDIELIKPELIIISGDLTQRAKKKQFLALLAFLQKLSATVLIVPGNHDIPAYNLFERLFAPFRAFKHYIGNRYQSFFTNSITTILGVNSVNPWAIKDGKLAKKRLIDIKTYFSQEKKAINILFFHHNFAHIKGMHKPLENDEQFLSYLKNSEVNIVCTGHLHYAKVSVLYKNNDKPCLILHAGTLLCTRSKDGLNSYYVIDIKNKKTVVDWRVFTGNQFSLHGKYAIDLAEEKAELRQLTLV